jgi:hypothetical protein
VLGFGEFCIFVKLTAKISFTVHNFLDMATSYSGFTTIESIKKLGLQVQRKGLFPEIQPIVPDAALVSLLGKNRRLPLGNEKVKSEMLVAPILSEMWSRNEAACTLFSGYILDVDAEQGLTGRCDFLFSAINSVIVEAPIIAIVEAKNDNVDEAIPQCAAQLLASQMFNEQNSHPTSVLYGATTTGFEWLFMKLIGSVITVDTDIYQLRNLPELIGVLQYVINYYKEHSFTH